MENTHIALKENKDVVLGAREDGQLQLQKRQSANKLQEWLVYNGIS
jgi:hypothetical protein